MYQSLDDICYNTNEDIFARGHFHISIQPLRFSVYKLTLIPRHSYPIHFNNLSEKYLSKYQQGIRTKDDIHIPSSYLHKGLCIYNYQYRCFHYFPYIIGNVISCNHTIILYTQGNPITTFPYHEHCYRNLLFYKSIPAIYASY